MKIEDLIKELEEKGVSEEAISEVKRYRDRLRVYEEQVRMVTVTMTNAQHVKFFQWEQEQEEAKINHGG